MQDLEFLKLNPWGLEVYTRENQSWRLRIEKLEKIKFGHGNFPFTTGTEPAARNRQHGNGGTESAARKGTGCASKCPTLKMS